MKYYLTAILIAIAPLAVLTFQSVVAVGSQRSSTAEPVDVQKLLDNSSALIQQVRAETADQASHGALALATLHVSTPELVTEVNTSGRAKELLSAWAQFHAADALFDKCVVEMVPEKKGTTASIEDLQADIARLETFRGEVKAAAARLRATGDIDKWIAGRIKLASARIRILTEEQQARIKGITEERENESWVAQAKDAFRKADYQGCIRLLSQCHAPVPRQAKVGIIRAKFHLRGKELVERASSMIASDKVSDAEPLLADLTALSNTKLEVDGTDIEVNDGGDERLRERCRKLASDIRIIASLNKLGELDRLSSWAEQAEKVLSAYSGESAQRKISERLERGLKANIGPKTRADDGLKVAITKQGVVLKGVFVVQGGGERYSYWPNREVQLANPNSPQTVGIRDLLVQPTTPKPVEAVASYTQARAELMTHWKRKSSWEQLANRCAMLEEELEEYREKFKDGASVSFAAERDWAQEVIRNWSALEALLQLL